MPLSAGSHADQTDALDAYMDLMWCEGAMELSIGRVDHLDHISLADTLHRLEIRLDISLFRIFGQAEDGAAARFRGHDDYSSGRDVDDVK